MSNYQFFASNKPLKEVENKKIEFISFKEADERDIKIDTDLIGDIDLESDEKIYSDRILFKSLNAWLLKNS